MWEEIGLGWKSIVDEAIQKIHKENNNICILQVKEKFGGLRIYVGFPEDISDAVYDNVTDIIKNAEIKASVVCELCGKPGGQCKIGSSWLKTLCLFCWEKAQ